MALAPPVVGNGPRPPSFLPAITCSNCGREIEIASMGDHDCGAAPLHAEPAQNYTSEMGNPYALQPPSHPEPQPLAMPPMPAMPDALDFQLPQSTPPPRAKTPTLSPNPNVGPKASRVPPPRINPDAANRPFLAPRFDSPLSPALSTKSNGSNGAKPGIARSATSPMPRLQNPNPPSPELSANMDCAFPPFPTSTASSGRPSTSSGRKTSSERAPSRSASRLGRALKPMPASSDLEPKSPRLNAGESVLQRLNTLKSGPFNAKKKSSSGDSRPGLSFFGRRRTSTSSGQAHQVQTVTPAMPALEPPPPLPEMSLPVSRPDRPTTKDMFSPTFLNQFSAEPSVLEGADSLLPRVSTPPPTNSEQIHTEQLQSEAPIEHPEPLKHDEPSTPENPFAQQVKPAPHEPEAHLTLSGLEVPKPSQLSRNEPSAPIDQGEDSTQVDHRAHDAPLAPKPVQRPRQESINAPSESGYSTVSSSNSAMHSNGTGSRRPSPVTSAASSIDAFSPLSYDPVKYAEDEQMRVPYLRVRTQEQLEPTNEEAQMKSPPRNFARPVPQIASPPAPDHAATSPLESPMDPALQNRMGFPSIGSSHGASPPMAPPKRIDSVPEALRSGPRPPPPPAPAMPNSSNAYGSYRPGPPGPGSRPPPANHRSPQRERNNPGPAPPRVPSPSSARSPATPVDPQARPASRRGTSAKPMCRGCGQPIEGKSVKAADGRLTGRWHKACFVCRACREPFTTADFYVINNEPFCEQHYHEHNGSLCAGCNRGIEGQFIETSSTTRPGLMDKKFHPRCFTCWECRSVLADDYFEINGKVFCERHALAAMRAQARAGGAGAGRPGGLAPPNSRSLTAERRTTRLMMMS